MLKQTIRPDIALTGFDRSLVIASHFGFLPINPPKIKRIDIEATRSCANLPHYDAVEKAAVIRTYLEEDFASRPHPLALVYKRKLPRQSFQFAQTGYTLHFIGSVSGIAEATLIRTALSILSEEGYKNLEVDINCIGDRESISAYERELSNYVRKSSVGLSDELKQSIKEDIFSLFRLDAPEMVLLRERAPSAITFLSAPSRIYFKEVLEFIEALGIEFRLAPELVGEKNLCSHTIFAIRDTGYEEHHALAVGYRYSRLSRLLGLRKEVPMVGVNIFPFQRSESQGRIYKELPKPKFYLVQLGREAKIKTLALIEILRLNRIPVHHLLGKDKIASQLLAAENLNASHIIIIGQKEALDNTAIVRNVLTRAQDTVAMRDLPRYLKNIRL